MRPPVRLLQPLETPTIRASKTLYVCSNCRYDVSLSHAVSQQHQSRRHAGSGNTTFTEKLRRRLWGTDNPPGLEDPYGGEGVIARQWNKRKSQYLGEKKSDVEQFENEDNALPEEDYEFSEPFVPAKTAHNLKRLGHLGVWQDFPPTENDVYRTFVSRMPATKSAQFHRAAQSIAVELCILHELKKPLSVACQVHGHLKVISSLIRKCRISESTNSASLDGLLEFPDEETKEALLFVFKQLGENPETQTEENAEIQKEETTVAQTEENIEMATEEPESQKVAKHKGYLKFPLTDPAVKFAFLKRFAQITGHHIHDGNAYTAQTVQDVVEHFEKTVCRPKTLVEDLKRLQSQQALPNVQIMEKPYTKSDHDREVGRDKIIREALHERGLLHSRKERDSRFRLGN